MPRIPYRLPTAGTDTIADAIRERRGARGLTPLDGTLLNAPAIAVKFHIYIRLSSKNIDVYFYWVFPLERMEHPSRCSAQQEQLAG
jgi:hypothetical protein